MKKLLRYIPAFAFVLVLSLCLAACTAQPPSSGSSSSSSASSLFESSVDSTSGDSPTVSSAYYSDFSDYSGVTVDDDDESYAQSHLSGDSYTPPDIKVKRNGTYTDKDHVALYIHTYGTVPSNYVTKNKARKAGWVNTEGNLWDVLPGKSIGGGGFYNDDGMMPDAPDREWFECDIDYQGGYRNAKRLVYSNDGLIYYTNDHYKTFQRLY